MNVLSKSGGSSTEPYNLSVTIAVGLWNREMTEEKTPRRSQIAIIIPSSKDWEAIQPLVDLLDNFGGKGVPNEVRVLSAYRTREELIKYINEAEQSGVEVFIAASGGTNELALTVAATTIRSVIAVPLRQSEISFATVSNEAAALTSCLETPDGYPILLIGFNHVENAAMAALQMLGIKDRNVRRLLTEERQRQHDRKLREDAEVSSTIEQRRLQRQNTKLRVA